MKPFQFSAPASAELTAAIRWYEQQRVGLGGDLFDAVNAAIDVLQHHPEAGASRPGRSSTRELLLRRFPYKLVYRVREHDLYLVALAHTSRRPDYWQNR